MIQGQEEKLTIGKLAAAGGVGVETVRFYQKSRLLETPSRNGGFRLYTPEHVRRLRFIKQAQGAGFTLREIKELLKLDAGSDRGRARELAKARIKALNEKIAELERACHALQRLARECSQSKSGPCPILASFGV